jgi:putative oxygen-independent coproporphyrinogen III oxidase
VSRSVYVHFPWCLQKCPYCDFASTTIKRPDVPHRAYADAVLLELEARAPALAGQPLESVFFGGGTPSLWEPAELGRVLARIRELAGSAPGEVTVECNPSSLDAARAAALREVGVDRLSIGVQSLNDARLRFLGRLHDADGALRALAEARRELPRVSGDLMFGMPGQRADDLLEELQRLSALELDHVSLYALTVEPNTRFGELSRKHKLQLAPEADYAECFMAAERFFAAQGLEHYEVSNYARPGQHSRHNAHYWRGGDYLGLGAGAVGCVSTGAGAGTARRYRNDPNAARYLERSGSARVEVESEPLTPADRMRERLMLGLRTQWGLDLQGVRAELGVEPHAGRERALDRALEQGNLVQTDTTWRVPHERWLHLDSIVTDLF